MPKCFVHKVVDRWMLDNEGKINHQLLEMSRRKYGYYFRFLGVTECIGVEIDRGGVTVWAECELSCPDIIWDSDIWWERSGRYYFNGSTSDYYEERGIDVPTWESRDQMFIDEALDPLLRWVNSTLDENHILLFYKFNGANEAKLIKKEQMYHFIKMKDWKWCVRAEDILSDLKQDGWEERYSS